MAISPQLARSLSIHPILRIVQAKSFLSLFKPTPCFCLGPQCLSSPALALNSGNLSYQLHPCVISTVLCALVSFPTNTISTANIHSNVMMWVSGDCFFVLLLSLSWLVDYYNCVCLQRNRRLCVGSERVAEYD